MVLLKTYIQYIGKAITPFGFIFFLCCISYLVLTFFFFLKNISVLSVTL